MRTAGALSMFAILAASCGGESTDCATACAARGMLCGGDDTCVEPWRYGAPQFSRCDGDPHATAESLAAKAAHYDELARRLHVHPELAFAQNVTLKASMSDPAEPAMPEATATIADVERWNSGENDGLWSALYLASQAYRYSVTKSEDALSMIRLLLDGEVTRMRITGVPGIFTRQYIPPNIPGIACPTDDASYTADAEKDDNRWVQIRDDGCVWFVDRMTSAWTKSAHCGLDDFEGYCFLDNVSKDEYAGHMLALAALLRLVEVPDVQEKVIDLLGQVGRHMVDNQLVLVDWDGRSTEHGHFSPLAFDDFPGFNAAMTLAYLGAAIRAAGDDYVKEYHRKCVLQRDGGMPCLGFERPEPFTAFLAAPGMYVGREGCGSNYNNVSMHMLSLHTFLLVEDDPVLRAAVQTSLDVDVMRKEGEPRAIIGQHNALFDFIWAAGKKLGPMSDGPAFEAVEDGVCQLRQFRPAQTSPAITPDPVRHAPYCKDRFDRDVSQNPREIWERCPSTFVWWGDPYGLGACTEDRREVRQPSGYLLPYWMGRYYGFIPEDL